MDTRPARLAASINKSAALILIQHIPDEYISVTDVEVTPDMRQATIWISVLDDSRRQDLLDMAKQETGKIKKQIAKDVRLRRMPELTLKLDDRELQDQAIMDAIRKDKQ